MLKINRYQDINNLEVEAKKDYIDRHSPFIHCGDHAKAGELFKVTVQVGKEYQHPDDTDHYIANIRLYSKSEKLAEATFYSGALGGQGAKGNQTVTFNIDLKGDTTLTAQSYCTKHGIWESDPVKVTVS